MSSHFTPTTAELALVNQIFTQADTQKIGILTGDVAVRVFGGAKLTPTVLGEIWSIADEDNKGFLTRKGVAIVVRLMGWAQKGDKISKELLNKSGPLANIDGFNSPLAPQGTGMSIPKSPPPTSPLLSPQDKAKFLRLFQSCGPVNGLLSGDKARDLFFKSKLPVDKLSQIWSLADTQDRGALDLTDFTIAMHLIQTAMSSQLSAIPTSLPPGLYEQAGGSAVIAHGTGSSTHLANSVASASSFPGKQLPVQTNFTGQSSAPTLASRRPAPLTQTPAISPFLGVVPQATGTWDVTSAEKASADRYFDSLDLHKRGYIEGDVAVPFMLQSKLPEEVLAQVWDLSDINNDGRLTRDGFAVAMHLIQGKLSGKEIPGSLPPTLVPPSMRANGPTSPFAATSQSHPTEAIRDLLWDDSPPASTVKTQPQPNIFQSQPIGTAPSAISPPPVSRAPRALEDPFFSAAPNSFHRDLLGDDDDTHSPPLQDRSAEIGNLQNHANSTNRSLQNAKAEREALEATLANQAAQLSALQTQLDSAKAAFETETGLLNTLKERHANQNAEIQKVREELIRSESDLSAVRMEKAEIEGAFLRDKEEVRDLNRRMSEVTTQIASTKQEVEKAKKDAKQQKGRLAIARKQFAAKESEKVKVEQELEEAQEDLENTIKEREEAEAEIEKMSASPHIFPEPGRAMSPVDSLSFAAAQPLPVTPDITGGVPQSPSGGKSNNPFERFAMSSGTSTPRSESPFRSFSAAAIPPPPGLPPPGLPSSNALDDPFGVSQALDSEQQPSSEVAPDNDVTDVGVSTPKVKVKAMFGEFSEVVSSPTDEELFSTPPNSITPVHPSGEATPHLPSLDSAAALFPALDDISSRKGDGRENETDLSTDLHDLDVNESDSDTDDEQESRERNLQQHDSHPPEVPVKNDLVAPPSFDDIFGSANDTLAVTSLHVSQAPLKTDVSPTQNGSPGVDAFGVPLTRPAATPEDSHESSFSFISTPVNVTGKDSSAISSFDEAFGKGSSSAPSQTASNFSFESAFEDNFDFVPASGTAVEVPTLSGVPPANGATPTQQNVVPAADNVQDLFPAPANGSIASKAVPTQGPTSFGDAFSSGLRPAPTNIPPPEQTAADQLGLGTISFDEAFGGLDASQALKLDNPSPPRASDFFTNLASPPQPDAGKQLQVVSPPTSPRGPTSPRVTSSIRSNSPQPRNTSPPPRVASPRAQRPSTSSSKEVAYEKPAPPPRHSKLSQIRLPFGKRKKQETLPPMPTPQSTQPLGRVDEPGVVAPVTDDDVEPVKQLAAMGFGRSLAVAALETHDYDFQRALNSLLSA